MRIAHEGKWVCIDVAGRLFLRDYLRFQSNEWQLNKEDWQLDLNVYEPWTIGTIFGDFYLDGIDLTIAQLSQILATPRFDPPRAEEIWNSRSSVGNTKVRIDFHEKELVEAIGFAGPELLRVVPFSALKALRQRPLPELVGKFEGYVIGLDFPLPTAELSDFLHLPIVDSA